MLLTTLFRTTNTRSLPFSVWFIDILIAPNELASFFKNCMVLVNNGLKFVIFTHTVLSGELSTFSMLSLLKGL
jgi:hypothetical protein